MSPQGRPAKPCHDHRLAHVRACPLDHYCGHRAPPQVARSVAVDASGGDIFAKMKEQARKRSRRAAGRRGGGGAALSPWAVIGVPACTAFRGLRGKVDISLLSSWLKYPFRRCNVSQTAGGLHHIGDQGLVAAPRDVDPLGRYHAVPSDRVQDPGPFPAGAGGDVGDSLAGFRALSPAARNTACNWATALQRRTVPSPVT